MNLAVSDLVLISIVVPFNIVSKFCNYMDTHRVLCTIYDCNYIISVEYKHMLL